MNLFIKNFKIFKIQNLSSNVCVFFINKYNKNKNLCDNLPSELNSNFLVKFKVERSEET